MNYFFLGAGILYLYYAYAELNSGYVADSLFYRHKVPVKSWAEAAKEDDKYRIVFCKIRRKYRKEFEKALDEIENKMSLLGHNDYREFCDEMKKMQRNSGPSSKNKASIVGASAE